MPTLAWIGICMFVLSAKEREGSARTERPVDCCEIGHDRRLRVVHHSPPQDSNGTASVGLRARARGMPFMAPPSMPAGAYGHAKAMCRRVYQAASVGKVDADIGADRAASGTSGRYERR